MLIVSDSLRQLCEQHNITSDRGGIEEFSVRLTLGNSAKRFIESIDSINVTQNPAEAEIESVDLRNVALSIKPGCGVLAATKEMVNIPLGYFGLIQTKGTIARFLVQATCCDGQIEPGYNGCITLEIVNFNTRTVVIPAGTAIAQLFLFATQPKGNGSYNGRYQGAREPTLPKPVF